MPPADMLIVAAVREELEWLAGRIHEPLERTLGPHRVTTGRHDHKAVSLLVTGAGTVNTAGTLGAVLPALKPRGVVLCGCGGAFSGCGLTHGDVVIATEEISAQLGVEPARRGGVVKPLSFLPNRIELDKGLVERALKTLLEDEFFSGISVCCGPFVTVSTVTASPSTAESYRRHYGAVVENMEGFAAACVCRGYSVPFLEVRSISNMVGAGDRSAWDLDLAFRRAQEAVSALLIKEIVP